MKSYPQAHSNLYTTVDLTGNDKPAMIEFRRVFFALPCCFIAGILAGYCFAMLVR